MLCKFYPSLRKKKGGLDRKGSYLAARAAVNRKNQELKRPFNIFRSDVFTELHRVLDATWKVKKVEGLEPPVEHC